ncbi:MAG: RNA polymerase sigma factor [Chloroflexota bacterium]
MSIAAWAEESTAGEERYGEERARIVGLCRRITGDADSAEDLAQETLAEAWRLRDRLTDPAGFDSWLSAIARNVCMRWMRSHGRLKQIEGNGELPDVADEWGS